MPDSRAQKTMMRPDEMSMMPKKEKMGPYDKEIKDMQKQGIVGMMKMAGKTALQMMKGGSPTSPPKKKMR